MADISFDLKQQAKQERALDDLDCITNRTNSAEIIGAAYYHCDIADREKVAGILRKGLARRVREGRKGLARRVREGRKGLVRAFREDKDT